MLEIKKINPVVRALLFSVPLVLFLQIYYGVLWNVGYYPMITNSISLDAKILDLRAHRFRTIDVLAAGSSMSLNNVNSAEMILSDQSNTYYNLGAWGLQISDLLQLLTYYSQVYKPHYVIISSSLPDFYGEEKIDVPEHYQLALADHFLPYFYFWSTLPAMIMRREEYEKYKLDIHNYTNLNFDPYGGAVLDMSADRISERRWNEPLNFPTKGTDLQYEKLKELAVFLKNKGIALLFVQSPIRSVLADSNTPIIQDHFNQCEAIVVKAGGRYLNLHNPLIYTDGLFVDRFHLSVSGSKVYTKQIAAELNKMFKPRVRESLSEMLVKE
jgi:hypothetical protein